MAAVCPSCGGGGGGHDGDHIAGSRGVDRGSFGGDGGAVTNRAGKFVALSLKLLDFAQLGNVIPRNLGPGVATQGGKTITVKFTCYAAACGQIWLKF